MAFFINVLYMKFPSTNKTDFLVYEEFSSVFLTRRVIIVYLEYQSAWPFDGIGSPTPSPPSECGSPQDPSGEAHSLAGDPIVTKGQNSDTLCILNSLYVLTLLSVINDHCIFYRRNYTIRPFCMKKNPSSRGAFLCFEM